MRIVLGILHFDRPNGAATYTHVVARHLARLGHEVRIHTPDAGAMATLARESGIPVGEESDDAAARPEALIAQDAMIAYELAARWPGVPQVFVAHGAYRDEAMPPQISEVVAAAVVMNDRVAHRVRGLAADVPIIRLRQPIDLERFRPRGRPAARARRAVLLGNYLQGHQREVLARALSANGIEARQVGDHGDSRLRPELAMAEADIVVGYGRSALEGLACGRPTYVFDHRGGDGWATRENYAELEANGFAGFASDEERGYEQLRADFAAYDPELGPVGRKLASRYHDAFHHGAALSAALKGLARPRPLDDAAENELARLSRLQWESEWRSNVLLADVSALQERVQAAEHRAESAERAAADLAARLSTLTATRRFKLAARMARPLDRLRDRAGRRR